VLLLHSVSAGHSQQSWLLLQRLLPYSISSVTSHQAGQQQASYLAVCALAQTCGVLCCVLPVLFQEAAVCVSVSRTHVALYDTAGLPCSTLLERSSSHLQQQAFGRSTGTSCRCMCVRACMHEHAHAFAISLSLLLGDGVNVE